MPIKGQEDYTKDENMNTPASKSWNIPSVIVWKLVRTHTYCSAHTSERKKMDFTNSGYGAEDMSMSEEKSLSVQQPVSYLVSVSADKSASNLEFFTLPVYFTPVYVDPTSYEYIISKKKCVDSTLDVFFISVNDSITNRPWAFTLVFAHLISLETNPKVELVFALCMEVDKT